MQTPASKTPASRSVWRNRRAIAVPWSMQIDFDVTDQPFWRIWRFPRDFLPKLARSVIPIRLQVKSGGEQRTLLPPLVLARSFKGGVG